MPVPILGSASYYDCPQNQGACGSCGSYLFECAWPNVTGHPPDYAAACGGIDQRACGSIFTVKNICNPYWVYSAPVKVADHGPNPSLVCGIDYPMCNPQGSNRYVDLTRATFIALNGNLSQGLMLVLVEW